MSDEVRFPNKKEVARLPKASIAVYALRCASKVQPLLVSEVLPKNFSKKTVLALHSEFETLIHTADDYAAAVAAEALADRIANSSESDKAPSAITLAATAIAKAAGAYSDAEDFKAAAAAIEAAAYAADAAAYIVGNQRALGILEAARVDFTDLREYNFKVTDASETGPLGDLWHGSPPDWYVRAKSYYDKTIAEWERELSEGENPKVELARRIESSEPEPLVSVYFDNSGFTDDEIAECLEYLSESYRSMGGIGLKVVNGNSLVPETEEASR